MAPALSDVKGRDYIVEGFADQGEKCSPPGGVAHSPGPRRLPGPAVGAARYGWGTSSVNGCAYAWRSVIRPTMAASTTLCQMTALKMSASLPIWFVAAVATQMLWASIILPITPPVLLAVLISTWA